MVSTHIITTVIRFLVYTVSSNKQLRKDGSTNMEKYLLALIRLLVTVLSPELRKSLGELLNDLTEKAKATDNEWDDILVSMLKRLLLGDDKPTGF